jgi:hypothetical protein
MNPELEKLDRLGAIVTSQSGTKGVHVTLQCNAPIKQVTRSAWRSALRAEFEHIKQSLEPQGAEVDLDSLSVTGQTVEALLPIDCYEELTNQLNQKGIRVDPLFDRRIV